MLIVLISPVKTCPNSFKPGASVGDGTLYIHDAVMFSLELSHWEKRVFNVQLVSSSSPVRMLCTDGLQRSRLTALPKSHMPSVLRTAMHSMNSASLLQKSDLSVLITLSLPMPYSSGTRPDLKLRMSSQNRINGLNL